MWSERVLESCEPAEIIVTPLCNVAGMDLPYAFSVAEFGQMLP